MSYQNGAVEYWKLQQRAKACIYQCDPSASSTEETIITITRCSIEKNVAVLAGYVQSVAGDAESSAAYSVRSPSTAAKDELDTHHMTTSGSENSTGMCLTASVGGLRRHSGVTQLHSACILVWRIRLLKTQLDLASPFSSIIGQNPYSSILTNQAQARV